jgi:heme/copper-type cytochrome/quinol oxidase subunit 2
MGLGMMGSQAVLKAATPATSGNDLITASATGTSGNSSGNTSTAVTLDDLTAVQSAIEGSSLSWWAESKGTIGTDARNTQADVYAVSGAFGDFHHMDMLFGSFIPRTRSGGMACVLESDLAYRLFGTQNAVGLEVQFMGKTFQVSGIVKSDPSLLGMLSSDGAFRAYISGYDLIDQKKMTVGGFEMLVPRGAPGESLQAVKSAMQSQNIGTGSFQLTDQTDQMKLDAEIALIPLVLLGVCAALVLIAFFIRAMRGMFRESLALVHEDYFSNVAGSIAWKLGKLVILLGVSVGVVLLIFKGIGLNFYLPAKYIPSSWIDPSFYSGIIKTGAQNAIAAQAYPRQWWNIAYSSAVSLSGILNAVAVIGLIASSLSLRALRADRRYAAEIERSKKARGVWDAPVLWILAFASFCGVMIMEAWMGLPVETSLGALLALALSLGVWALAMHKEEAERLFFKEEFSVRHKKDEPV